MTLDFGLTVDQSVNHGCERGTRAHRVDADAGLGVDDGRRARQPHDPMLAAGVAGCDPSPTKPITDAVLTMLPPPLLRILGSSYFIQRKTPVRLVSIIRSQESQCSDYGDGVFR